MIFEGRSIRDITEEEIDRLVREHVAERQHLEYKATVNYKKAEEKIELLRDIVSFANAGGGYIFVGIRDDGKGRAQKYEPSLLGNPESIMKSIKSLCLDYISERIEGIEVISCVVKGNPLVIVRVPESARAPHMVTYQNKTDFYTRYHDGKREMTIGDVKEGFSKDIVGKRLSNIEYHISRIIKREVLEKERNEIFEMINSGYVPQLLAIEDGTNMRDVAYQQFEREIKDKPYFWISATPVHPKANLIDFGNEDVKRSIIFPPGSNPGGWNMESSFEIEGSAEGIRKGKKDYKYLEIIGNGHMEFWAPLDEHFCWRQSAEEFRHRPRLYPYPVTEYPVSFLRLYKALVDLNKINDEFIITLAYKNINGYILRPYAPDTFGFAHSFSEIKPFNNQHLRFSQKVPDNFEPDIAAFDLLKNVYSAFGYGEEAIPFYKKGEGKFVFR